MSLDSFRKKFWNSKTVKKTIKDDFNSIIQSSFRQTLREVIEEVRNHPISQELTNHTSPSKFLPNYKGSGTLFGFMGFNEGQTPILELETFLRTHINYTANHNILKRLFGVKVSLSIPDKNEFRQGGFVLPWENGKSWPELIEDGDISGLSYFLGKKGDWSRSKEGIQAKHELRSAKFQGTPYLSPIFEKANRRFLEILNAGGTGIKFRN